MKKALLYFGAFILLIVVYAIPITIGVVAEKLAAWVDKLVRLLSRTWIGRYMARAYQEFTAAKQED